jgi:hypothetical protein
MSKYKDESRDAEAAELYFTILKARRRSGLPHDEAKACAFDAVEMRYGLKKRTMLNILYRNSARFNIDRNVFRADNEYLKKSLEDCNTQMLSLVTRNEALINLLEEMCNEADR